MKAAFIVIPFLVFSQQSVAVSEDYRLLMQKKFNEKFMEAIHESGNKALEIRDSDEVPTYIGGVTLETERIVVTIGSQQRSEYSEGSFRFILCHELGHILGGMPYKSAQLGKHYEGKKISTEGQSDYWAGLTCLREISTTPIEDALEFFTYLSNSLRPIVGDSSFYAPPALHVEDREFYDSEYSSFQCRFDTVRNGYLRKERPACWFNPN